MRSYSAQLLTSLAHDKCVQLLAEDARREQLRRQLEERRSKLLQGENLLNNLKNKYGGEGGNEDNADVEMLDEEMV